MPVNSGELRGELGCKKKAGDTSILNVKNSKINYNTPCCKRWILKLKCTREICRMDTPDYKPVL